MVGRALAGRLPELGHDVVIGTRDPEQTLARTEPDSSTLTPATIAASARRSPAARHPRRPHRARAGRRVFDRTVDLDGVPDGYRAMADGESIKVLVRP